MNKETKILLEKDRYNYMWNKIRLAGYNNYAAEAYFDAISDSVPKEENNERN